MTSCSENCSRSCPISALGCRWTASYADTSGTLGFGLAMTFQSKYLGMSPFQCPSLFSILSFLEYEYGVFHPIGGCAAVTRSMAQIAQELGVCDLNG